MKEISLEKLRESIIFESGYLCNTLKISEKKKDEFIEWIKFIWNQAVIRAGFTGNPLEVWFDENDIKKVVEYFSEVHARPYIAADSEHAGGKEPYQAYAAATAEEEENNDSNSIL